MNYFLKKTKPSKKGEYLQIYQSFYVKGKGCRNRSYKKIGYVADLIKNGISNPIAYFQKEVDKLNGKIEKNMAKQIGEVSACKNVGYFLVKAMFDYLGLDRDMNLMSQNYRSHYKMSDFVRTLVYAQFVNPGSKLQAFENVIPNLYDCPTFSYDQILDGINFIGEDTPKFVELINRYISKKWERNMNTVFFDCTNYYFEIDEQDDYRRFGPSKENKHCPIIGQALLLDADMIPLDTEFFPGNQSEKPYLRKRIEDMKTKNDVNGRVIQVADKGLNCARNIYAAVKEANDGYIFSKSVHGKWLSKIEKDWVIKDDDYNEWKEVRDDKNNILYKYKESVSLDEKGNLVPYDTYEYSCKVNPDDKKETKFMVKEKRIVTYNPALAKKQRREIQKEIDNLQRRLTYKEAIKDDLGDASKYVNLKATTIEGEQVKIIASLNQEKIDEDLKYAGYNLLVTSEINADPIDIYKAYHQLWRIEESFRIMETYLEARPVFLHNEESIYGHFMICYYALVIERLIELKIFNDEATPDEIFKFIRNYQVSENFDGSFVNNATRTKFYEMVKEKLGLAKLGNLYLTKRDLDNLLSTEF